MQTKKPKKEEEEEEEEEEAEEEKEEDPLELKKDQKENKLDKNYLIPNLNFVVLKSCRIRER